MASMRRTIIREIERQKVKKIRFSGNRQSRRQQTKNAKKENKKA